MTIVDVVKRLAEERLSVSPAAIESALTLRDAGIDSLAAIDLVVAVEERFAIRFAEQDLANLRSLEDLAAAVERLLEARRESP